jgi:DNA modification methylase
VSQYTLHHGDCLDVLPGLPVVDSIVTDPPAGIGFMGAEWDKDKGGRDAWVAWLSARLRAARERLRPGGYALVWALPRTSHWTALAIEDAGLVIQDRVIDILDGNDLMREFVDSLSPEQFAAFERAAGGPARMQAIFGSGFPKHKSHLKPAVEDWWLAYNPGGARALQVEACRVGWEPQDLDPKTNRNITPRAGLSHAEYEGVDGAFLDQVSVKRKPFVERMSPAGRWPPHLLLSHAADCDAAACVEGCPVRALGEQSGERASGARRPSERPDEQRKQWRFGTSGNVADTGTAARFFPQFYYAPKASRRERNEGCEGLEAKRVLIGAEGHKINPMTGREVVDIPRQNHHPTVKPLALMRWLVRLVTPPGGLVLDPFAGSGSTGCAAVLEGCGFVGVEASAEYLEIARARIAHYADPLRHMEAA